MSVDLRVLEESGCTQEVLKAKWTADPLDEKTKELRNLIRSRINEGIHKNLREARHWWAIDQAFDASFYQTTPTLARSLLSGKFDTAGVLKAAADWGLTHLIREETDPKGHTSRTIDIPAFFAITIPVAKAYVLIRSAKIFNDRNVFPQFKFEPAQLTMENRIRCEVITDRVQTIATQYDYIGVMRQAILSKMIYGICLQFPAERWHREIQEHYVKDKKQERIIKEGLRYNLPHPSRLFWDLNYRLGTFNSDTGCTYAGYWQVQRYGDIKDDDTYWNTDKITIGNDWMNVAPTFFATLYPCVMKFPVRDTPQPAGSAGGSTAGGAGALDRESQAGFYASEQSDQGVVLTQLFMKFVPKKYGFGKYEYPVWFRFVVASDDTIVYAEPLAYSPVIYRGYDAHEERELNASMVLEVLPTQDHISNLMTQQLLTIKQNLLAAVFVNEDAVGKGTMSKLQNLGQKLYVETNFIPFSAKAAAFAGKDIKEAFIPVNFPRLDTTAILTGIRTMLDLMERVLVMSSQEIGAAATHEQTAEETRVIQASTSNRLNFTASYDDDADLAWKKQLYDATMAHADDELYAQIGSAPTADVKKALEDLGFTVDEEGDQRKNTRTAVRGKKSALLFEEFASRREGADRINNVALANAMVQMLQVLIANPALYAAIGPVQVVKMVNEIASFSGFYKDFKLEVMPGSTPEEVQMQAQEQVGQMLAQMKQAIDEQMAAQQEQVGQALGQVAQGVQQANQVIPQLVQGLQQIAQQVQAMQQGTQQALQAIGAKDQQQDQAIVQIGEQLGALMQQAAIAAQSMMGPPPGPPPPPVGPPSPMGPPPPELVPV